MAKRKTVAKRKAVTKRKNAAKPKTVAKSKAKNKTPEDKIEALKRRAKELSGGQMETHTLDDYPEEVEGAFWQHVVDYEEAPWTTNFQQLEQAGVSLPAPDSLKDEELTAKLWEVIQKLALMHVYLDQTNHLSDRELYTHLWTDVLREETKALFMSPNAAWHIPLLGSGSEEHIRLYLKYYADEKERRQWQKDFGIDPLPEHEDPRYDRDRLLPKADYGEASGGEPN